jgi:hypothetical protein
MQRSIDKVLNKLEKSAHLSPDGKDWLIAACDIFHDSDLCLAGFPDLISASTVVQLVKKQIQIAVPTTGAGAVTSPNNWDANITLYPLLNPQQVVTSELVDVNGFVTNPLTTTNNLTTGGLVCAAGPSGSQLYPTVASVQATWPATYTSIGAPEYGKGNCRIIAMGFEVVNTTSQLNKQGQATVYRMPNFSTLQNYYKNVATTPAVIQSSTTENNRFPPATIADAQLLYGTRSWEAGEGCYVPSRLSSVENPLLQPSTMPDWYSAYDRQAGPTAPNSVVWSVGGATNADVANGPNIHAPFDLSGVYFTGLSFTTTLTVNIRWLIERMPGPQETDLVVLATPSAPYDPLALELYTYCMRDMPPGVRLAENPLGEWFKAALAKAADFIPQVGSALGTLIPGAGAIGAGLGAAARIASNLIPEKAALPASGSHNPSTSSVTTVATVPRNIRTQPTKRKRIVYKKK